MDAQKTYVLWLNRNTEEQAFSDRGARACQVAAHLSTEVRAVLANTEAPMRSTRSYRGQHLVQGVVHRGLLFGVERVHGAHQNFERIARKRFLTFVRQSQTDAPPIRLGSLSDEVPTCLKRLNGVRFSATARCSKDRGCPRGTGGPACAGGDNATHPLDQAAVAVIDLG